LKASEKLLFSKKAEDLKDLKSIKDMVSPICEISGNWQKKLVIGGKVYWDIDKDIPFR
jgi:hypothetical protein